MPELLISQHLPWRISDVSSKVAQIANYCFYQIAMGRWIAGSKLPSVRRLEAEWSVNRITILKAYNSLVVQGLVDHKPNGSYYVAQQCPKRNFTRDRIELENLYKKIAEKIRKETDLSPLGVFRVLVRIAESELTENPEIAFVECSRSQAVGHAQEITEKLQVPVLPLSLDEIQGKKTRLPSSVRVVFTTSFHIDELGNLRKNGTEVVALPIEISRTLLSEIADQQKEVVFLESNEALAQRTTKDAIWMMGIKDPKVEITPVIDAYLSAYAESNKDKLQNILFLIPQKEWEDLEAKWGGHAFVKPIICTLNEAAWPLIVKTLRVPFGACISK